MNFLLPERKTAQIIIPNFMFSQRTESTEGGQPEIKSLHVICSTVVFFCKRWSRDEQGTYHYASLD